MLLHAPAGSRTFMRPDDTQAEAARPQRSVRERVGWPCILCCCCRACHARTECHQPTLALGCTCCSSLATRNWRPSGRSAVCLGGVYKGLVRGAFFCCLSLGCARSTKPWSVLLDWFCACLVSMYTAVHVSVSQLVSAGCPLVCIVSAQYCTSGALCVVRPPGRCACCASTSSLACQLLAAHIRVGCSSVRALLSIARALLVLAAAAVVTHLFLLPRLCYVCVVLSRCQLQCRCCLINYLLHCVLLLFPDGHCCSCTVP